MKMLRKIIDSKFEKFSAKYHDGVWFSKITILQSKYCSPTLNIPTNYYRNKFRLALLSREWALKKQSMLYQIFTKLRPGSKQRAILQKAEHILDPCERYEFWCKKTSLVKTSFQLSCWSRVCTCNFIKSRHHHRGFSTWVLQDSSS